MFRACSLISILCCSALHAWASTAGPLPVETIRALPGQPWHVTSFLEAAGLQGGAVFVIDFESDGIVWIAASDGLYRYDGYLWRRFTTADGLPSNYVRCVRVTRDGELWVGTDRGAGVFDGRNFDERGSRGNLAGPSVRRIFEDPDGTLWFACDHWPPRDVPAGLTRHRDGVWKSWRAEHGLPSDYVSDVFRDSSGSHFVLTRRGLARFDEESLELPIERAGLAECRDYIWSMIETPDDELVVSSEEWFCVRKDGRWYSLPNDAPRINMGQFAATRDGKVIGCTSESKARFVEWKNGRLVPIWDTQLDTRAGVQFITEAPDGAVWVAGVDVLARWERVASEWQSFDNLPGPQLRDHEGGVWFADRDRVMRLKDDRWTRFPGASAPLIRDSASGIWMRVESGLAVWRSETRTYFSEAAIGVENPRDPKAGVDGVWVIGKGPSGRDCAARYDGRAWTVHPLADVMPTETVVFGTPDSDRGMWYVLNDSATELYRLLLVRGARTLEVPLPTAARRYLLPRVRADRSRRLWLFGWMGLYRKELDVDGSAWQPIEELPGRQLTDVVELRDNVWFSYMGTTGGSGGLSRLHDGAWTHFPVPARRLTGQEGDDTLFYAHPRGVSIVAAESEGEPRLLTFPGSARVTSIVPGSNGDLWVGTLDRVDHFRPDGIPPETVIAHGETDLFHGDDLVLQVRGVERFKPQASPGDFAVAIRLDEQPWGEFRPLSDGRVAIGNVATGEHVVRVRVRDQGQDVDPSPADWRFQLHPLPLQDRAWFQPLAIGIVVTVLLLAGVSVVARRREIGQRLRKQELEHEILGVGERAQRRIGRDLHDSLGQRLTSVSFQCEALRVMLERSDDASGSEHAKEIGVAIRESISEVQVLAQALYPPEIEHGDLESALGNLVTSVVKGFDGTCTYRHRWSPAGLSREQALNVYRMVQEALGNALRHAGAETIVVELRRDGGSWIVEVRDDGAGFDAETPGTGLGQQIMRYRADRIGGRLSVHSLPGVGTTVRCVVPTTEDA